MTWPFLCILEKSSITKKFDRKVAKCKQYKRIPWNKEHVNCFLTIDCNVNLLLVHKINQKKTLFSITVPIRERLQDFHKWIDFSNLLIFGCQLSCSTETVPNHTPKTFIFLTHVSPKGSSWCHLKAPTHIASIVLRFNFAPEPLSCKKKTSKSAAKEGRSLKKCQIFISK